MAPGEFMAQVRAVMRLRHLSSRTEQSYCYVIKRFICYHNKRHSSEMGAEEVTAYLTHLASDRQVSISTQHVALCALLFLYRVVLQQPLPEVLEFVRTRRHPRLPVVFTRTEVHMILARLEIPTCSWLSCCTVLVCVSWSVYGCASRIVKRHHF